MATQSKAVAVITGVGPGLGAALAHRFATSYAVAILARKADYLKSLASEIRKSGATVLDLPCDVSDPAQISNAFRAIRNDLGEPEMFAMRGLAQSLARDLGPRGIHVAWINVDGSIDIPGARGLKPSLKDGDFLKPDAIAETYWHLAHQDPSAWTMELEVRPFKEKF